MSGPAAQAPLLEPLPAFWSFLASDQQLVAEKPVLIQRISCRAGQPPGRPLRTYWARDGSPFCSLFRVAKGYHYRLSSGDVLLDRDTGRVQFFWNGAEANGIDDFLADMVAPEILSALGELVIHASAVASPAGGLLLVGRSGAGKSTLALALHQAGYAVLADDAVRVLPGNRVPLLNPRLKLRGELPGDASFPKSSSGKRIVELERQYHGEPPHIRRIVFLDPTPDVRPHIEPIDRAAAFSRLMESRFILDPDDSTVIGRHLEKAVMLLETTEIARVIFPNQRDQLGETVREIVRSWN